MRPLPEVRTVTATLAGVRAMLDEARRLYAELMERLSDPELMEPGYPTRSPGTASSGPVSGPSYGDRVGELVIGRRPKDELRWHLEQAAQSVADAHTFMLSAISHLRRCLPPSDLAEPNLIERCVNCASVRNPATNKPVWMPAKAHHRCSACLSWIARHDGVERPREAILAALEGRRYIERAPTKRTSRKAR